MPKKAKPSGGKELVFSRAHVAARDRVYIASEKPEVVEDGFENTKLLRYYRGGWTHRAVLWGSVAVTARKMAKDTFECVLVGAHGNAVVGLPAGWTDEEVDPSPAGPERVGHLRDARFVGDRVYAVGMARMAYRRDGPGAWTRIDQGLRDRGKDRIRGLQAVDGFSEKNIWAVGFGGEIWRYDGKAWEEVDSPTNVVLHQVRCVEPDRVYACGAGGVLLQGRRGRFEAIEQDVTTENLHGLEWFKDRLYVAAQKTLYVWDGKDLEPVDLGLGDGVTTGDLHANDGMLWSTGARHLAWTDDGTTWTQVFVT